MSEPTRPAVVVEQIPEESRFVVRTAKGEGELRYNVIGEQIILEHTEVPKAMEGQGIAGALAKFGLEYARDHNLRVIPVCPFVISYLKRHPEYQALLGKRPA